MKVRRAPSWATLSVDGASYLVDGERLEVVEYASGLEGALGAQVAGSVPTPAR